ncbi:T9SS type B sorting domain-containing protein [Winogradskyella undariae]|uniref:T9SS type B sorting domain-containing protein n=1 Tax=Winogradskyella undariae TaxID=1285465 RepID=UPI00156B7916|nr:T9SS type B sorting domain-containing protein [Winogradskyella undariae]
MRNSLLDLKLLVFISISLLFSKEMHGQLGFCQGNSGDPIFSETFGSGTDYGPGLPTGTTTYTFVNTTGPQDGEYTISQNTFSYGWNLPSDHTGDVNGKALIVNASFTTGEFYNIAVSGLCENTTYEFSSWLINILPSSGCGGNGIPVNVEFQIWDDTNTSLLANGNTGDIYGSATPNWEQYGLVFQTLPGQTSVILKIINNGAGGCGNDLAIDDIIFKSCGDLIATEDNGTGNSIEMCSTQAPFSDTITAIPDNTVFSTHFYQWQVSNDGVNWTDLAGEINASIGVSGITTTTYYRAKVAEYAANLNNSDCLTFSDVYEIVINQAPPPPIMACWETATFDDLSCSWTVVGTQPVEPVGLECWESTFFNTNTCTWEINGTQPIQPTLECWEIATFNDITCTWDILGAQPVQPNIECWETATFNSTTCVWDVSGTQPVQPALECWETATFNDITCSWDVSGAQPVQPTLECWETTIFNTTTCTWDISGIQPAQPTLECWEIATFNDITCSWDVSGTQPVQPTLECWETTIFNTITCTWDISGIQPVQPDLECWEIATFNDITCSWDVSGAQPAQPTLECWETTIFNTTTCSWDIVGAQPIEFIEEFLSFCDGNEVVMQADSDIVNPTYQWSSGEVTEFKTVDVAGTYEVLITDGCFTIEKTIYVEQIPTPNIESITSDGSSIIVNMSNSGDFEYSLDGISFQFSSIFSNMDAGSYTIYVKAFDCDVIIVMNYFHFFIQKFITPNGDGQNDFFALNLVPYFRTSEVYIFDRYGKLLFSSINRNVFWDGTFNNEDLPTSDYWYRIVLDGEEFVGHFGLKR